MPRLRPLSEAARRQAQPERPAEPIKRIGCIMIICDTDNIAGKPIRPSPQDIEEESRRQMEALKDLRRRLQQVVRARPTGLIRLIA